MTGADVSEGASRALDITGKASDAIVLAMLDSIVKSLRDGKRVEIRGFGGFATRQRRPRAARNPKTAARVEVPAKRVPYFKPSKELTNLVNSASVPTPPPTAEADGPGLLPIVCLQIIQQRNLLFQLIEIVTTHGLLDSIGRIRQTAPRSQARMVGVRRKCSP
jgi:integration host factor subunit beta